MSKRTAPNAIGDANDLSQLSAIVVDKRNGKRSGAKKSRRNRHYEKQLIKNALSAGLLDRSQLLNDDAEPAASPGAGRD
jgi:hypothetical protein